MMNKFRQLICLFSVWVASSLVLIACGDDSSDDMAVNIEIPTIYKTLQFSKLGGAQSVLIQSTVDLSFSSSESWITTENEESTSLKYCKTKVECAANNTSAERTAVITVTASGFSGTIAVSQAAGDVLSLVNQELQQIETDASDDSYDITVTASGLPEFSADAFWLTSEDPIDNEDGTYTFPVTIAENFTTNARQGVITISNGSASVTINVSQEAGEDNTIGMNSDAKTLASKMYACVNIGNTLEATGGETSWGNPLITDAYIAGLKTLGFRAVRIPCAWHSHMSDAANYTIDPTWMARVKTVIDYCVANQMYAILNCHWDGGWLEDNIFNASKESAIVAEQRAIWTQVANTFKDYNEYLLFAGGNELGMNETSSGGKAWTDAAAVARVIKYEQTFIDAVRATGGNNAKRCLVVQGLGTDITNTNTYMTTLPTDQIENRLMVEIHYYEPYQFALMENDATWGKVFWYWGNPNHKEGSNHNPTWGEEDYVSEQFQKMKTKFVDKGYPVILGEYSARVQTASGRYDKTEEFDTDLHNASRAYFNKVVTREAKNNGCVPCYWETGIDINRTNGTAKCQYAIDGIMEGASEGSYPY